MKKLLELDLKPRYALLVRQLVTVWLTTSYRDILTRQSFLNAVAIVNVLGGSTNSVLHLLAMARAADIDLTIDDFQVVADRTPYLCDLRCVSLSLGRLIQSLIRAHVGAARLGTTSWRTCTKWAASPRS